MHKVVPEEYSIPIIYENFGGGELSPETIEFGVVVVRFFLHYKRLFPDHRFLLFVLQNIAGYKNGLNVCFNEMALFRPFAALIKGCSSYSRNGGQLTRGEG